MKKVAILTGFLIVAFLVFARPAMAAPVIDGVISEGEWDACYLGTSNTSWSGGMSVDVYGYADDTYLYAAYVADMSQPGWGVGAGLCISSNLYFKTPQSAEWPEPGYTILGFGGDGIGQTDGSGLDFDSFGGWGIQPNEWENVGIEYYVGDGCYNTTPNPNVAEVKIPLNLLTYAGDDGQIILSGQYWQYDGATPFYVQLPDTTAPIVTIESPTESSLVSGIVNIYGTIVEDTELSHYNIAIYPGDADFMDFSKRLEQKTVYQSSGFKNELIYQWDTTKYEDGWYLIRLAARDKAGNRDLSGDPYKGGDDSQHVIKVFVGNTKAGILKYSGVPGKGLGNAPGLQKPFNPKSQAAEHAGKK